MRLQFAMRQRRAVLIAVYPHNYHSQSKPFFVNLEEADYLERIKAASRQMVGHGRQRIVILVLSKPVTDHLQLRSSTGPALTFACLWAALKGRTAEDSESMALAESFAPHHMPVTRCPEWRTPDVLFDKGLYRGELETISMES